MGDKPEIRTSAHVYEWLEPRILAFDEQVRQLMLQLGNGDPDRGAPREVSDFRIRQLIDRRTQTFEFALHLAQRLIRASGNSVPTPQAMAAAMDRVEHSTLPADLANAKAAWVDLQESTPDGRPKRRIGYKSDD